MASLSSWSYPISNFEAIEQERKLRQMEYQLRQAQRDLDKYMLSQAKQAWPKDEYKWFEKEIESSAKKWVDVVAGQDKIKPYTWKAPDQTQSMPRSVYLGGTVSKTISDRDGNRYYNAWDGSEGVKKTYVETPSGVVMEKKKFKELKKKDLERIAENKRKQKHKRALKLCFWARQSKLRKLNEIKHE